MKKQFQTGDQVQTLEGNGVVIKSTIQMVREMENIINRIPKSKWREVESVQVRIGKKTLNLTVGRSKIKHIKP